LNLLKSFLIISLVKRITAEEALISDWFQDTEIIFDYLW
jgi:hypothetical protein